MLRSNGLLSGSLLIVSLVFSPVQSTSSKCFADPFDKGDCDEKLMRWSFNEQWETCTPFIYGGCGGTDNQFLSKEECVEACVGNHLNLAAVELTNGPKERSTGLDASASVPKSPLTLTISNTNVGQNTKDLPAIRNVSLPTNTKPFELSTPIDPLPTFSTASRCSDVMANVATKRKDSKCENVGSSSASDSSKTTKGWTYSHATKSCISLPYLQAGCAQTKNKFIDKTECENVCIKMIESSNNKRGGVRHMFDSEESYPRHHRHHYRPYRHHRYHRRHHRHPKRHQRHQNSEIRSSVSDWITSCSDYPVWVVDKFRKHWLVGHHHQSEQHGYSYRRSTNQCVWVRDIVKSPTLNKFYTKHECHRCKNLKYERVSPCEQNPRIAPPYSCEFNQYHHRRHLRRWAYFDGKCVPYTHNICEMTQNAFHSHSSCHRSCKSHQKRRHHGYGHVSHYGRNTYDTRHRRYQGLFFFKPHRLHYQGLFFYYLPHHIPHHLRHMRYQKLKSYLRREHYRETHGRRHHSYQRSELEHDLSREQGSNVGRPQVEGQMEKVEEQMHQATRSINKKKNFDIPAVLTVKSSAPRCVAFPPPLGTCKESQNFKPAWVYLEKECKEIVFNWCQGQFNEAKDNIFRSKDDCLQACNSISKSSGMTPSAMVVASPGPRHSPNRAQAFSSRKDGRCSAIPTELIKCSIPPGSSSKHSSSGSQRRRANVNSREEVDEERAENNSHENDGQRYRASRRSYDSREPDHNPENSMEDRYGARSQSHSLNENSYRSKIDESNENEHRGHSDYSNENGQRGRSDDSTENRYKADLDDSSESRYGARQRSGDSKEDVEVEDDFNQQNGRSSNGDETSESHESSDRHARRKRSVEGESDLEELVQIDGAGRMAEEDDDDKEENEVQSARSEQEDSGEDSEEAPEAAGRSEINNEVTDNTESEEKNKDDDANGQEGRSAQSNEKSSEEKEGAELTRRKRETSKSRSRSAYTFVNGDCIKLKPKRGECLDKTKNHFKSRKACLKACV